MPTSVTIKQGMSDENWQRVRRLIVDGQARVVDGSQVYDPPHEPQHEHDRPRDYTMVGAVVEVVDNPVELVTTELVEGEGPIHRWEPVDVSWLMSHPNVKVR